MPCTLIKLSILAAAASAFGLAPAGSPARPALLCVRASVRLVAEPELESPHADDAVTTSELTPTSPAFGADRPFRATLRRRALNTISELDRPASAALEREKHSLLARSERGLLLPAAGASLALAGSKSVGPRLAGLIFFAGRLVTAAIARRPSSDPRVLVAWPNATRAALRCVSLSAESASLLALSLALALAAASAAAELAVRGVMGRAHVLLAPGGDGEPARLRALDASGANAAWSRLRSGEVLGDVKAAAKATVKAAAGAAAPRAPPAPAADGGTVDAVATPPPGEGEAPVTNGEAPVGSAAEPTAAYGTDEAEPTAAYGTDEAVWYVPSASTNAEVRLLLTTSSRLSAAHLALAAAAATWAAEAGFVFGLALSQRGRLLALGALLALRRRSRDARPAARSLFGALPKSPDELAQSFNYQLNYWVRGGHAGRRWLVPRRGGLGGLGEVDLVGSARWTWWARRGGLGGLGSVDLVARRE